MRIAIDARLNAYRRGGIPQYTRNLLTALAEVDRENRYVSLQHRQMLRPLAVASNVRRHVIYTPPHNRFEQWSLPLELLLVRPDLLHCPDFIAPVRRTFPVIVTIHDLAFMQYPEILDSDARQYYGNLARSTAHAEGIIAVSESTRQDIAQYLDIPIEHIDVVYEAAAPLFRPIEMREGEARVLNGEPVAADSFMLFVSTLEPRKNLPTLLQALRICLDRRPDRDYQLVIVGGRGWKDQPIFDAARDLNLGDHVLFAGNVGVYDLRWLYNACRFYINPSLYEGFGLPLLEAMACGAPCLASATSSLPEIGGDAAIYVPPLDPGLWADAIEQLWDDRERQEDLGRAGRARASRFSWERAARETLKIYERVASGAPRPATASNEEPERQLVPEVGASRRRPTESARACLRCGTQLAAGELQHDLTIRRSDDAAEYNVLATRAWICPNCGQVELVSEWRALVPELISAGALDSTSARSEGDVEVDEPVEASDATSVTMADETVLAADQTVTIEEQAEQPGSDAKEEFALVRESVATQPFALPDEAESIAATETDEAESVAVPGAAEEATEPEAAAEAAETDDASAAANDVLHSPQHVSQPEPTLYDVVLEDIQATGDDEGGDGDDTAVRNDAAMSVHALHVLPPEEAPVAVEHHANGQYTDDPVPLSNEPDEHELITTEGQTAPSRRQRGRSRRKRA